MFQGLINDAKSAAGSLIAKYLARASVAVPFVIALGFATAAITFMLVERFGAITASWMVAGGFTLIGLVATLAVTVKEQEEEVAEKQAEEDRYRRRRHRCRRAGRRPDAAGAARRRSLDPDRAKHGRGRGEVAGAQYSAGRAAGADRLAVLAERAHGGSRRRTPTIHTRASRMAPSLRPVPNGYHPEAAA